jgi:hypothetical protein
MPVIGILTGGSAESFAPFEPAFRNGLTRASIKFRMNLSKKMDGRVKPGHDGIACCCAIHPSS